MTTREAAAYLGVGDRYIRHLIEIGRLRTRGGGGRHQVVREDVMRLSESRRCRHNRSR